MAKVIRIMEVGPRDGLQNIQTNIPTKMKIEFINDLRNAGLKHIEVASFVSPKWVPQMADSADVCQALTFDDKCTYWGLIPNLKGLELAQKTQLNHFAVFASASETFSIKNTNAGIEDNLANFKAMIDQIKSKTVNSPLSSEKMPLKIRGYISCVLGCPFEGNISSSVVVKIAKSLLSMGCNEISLGDTIGVGTAGKVKDLIRLIASELSLHQISVHFHDTYGQGLSNIYASLEEGIISIDSSAGGLGGCPYALGATGNVATEDVLYLLEGLGIKTGISIEGVIQAQMKICNYLNVPPPSRVANAMLAKMRSK